MAISDIKVNITVDEKSLDELKERLNRLQVILAEADEIIDSMKKTQLRQKVTALNS